jgi:hypothetical protein
MNMLVGVLVFIEIAILAAIVAVVTWPYWAPHSWRMAMSTAFGSLRDHLTHRGHAH